LQLQQLCRLLKSAGSSLIALKESLDLKLSKLIEDIKSNGLDTLPDELLANVIGFYVNDGRLVSGSDRLRRIGLLAGVNRRFRDLVYTDLELWSVIDKSLTETQLRRVLGAGNGPLDIKFTSLMYVEHFDLLFSHGHRWRRIEFEDYIFSFDGDEPPPNLSSCREISLPKPEWASSDQDFEQKTTRYTAFLSNWNVPGVQKLHMWEVVPENGMYSACTELSIRLHSIVHSDPLQFAKFIQSLGSLHSLTIEMDKSRGCDLRHWGDVRITQTVLPNILSLSVHVDGIDNSNEYDPLCSFLQSLHMPNLQALDHRIIYSEEKQFTLDTSKFPFSQSFGKSITSLSMELSTRGRPWIVAIARDVGLDLAIFPKEFPALEYLDLVLPHERPHVSNFAGLSFHKHLRRLTIHGLPFASSGGKEVLRMMLSAFKRERRTLKHLRLLTCSDLVRYLSTEDLEAENPDTLITMARWPLWLVDVAISQW
jgi:hypothetical protein